MPSSNKTKNGRLTTNIVRLCINGSCVNTLSKGANNFHTASDLLRRALGKSWPTNGRRVEFTVLPGGFIVNKLPETLDVNTGWQSNAEDFKKLTKYGRECIRHVFTGDLVAELAQRTKYLTLGIDLRDMDDQKTDKWTIRRSHVELVVILKLTAKSATVVAWTGKSYPTRSQENSLVHVVDLNTHCVEIDGLRVLVLGCHDLNMFSERSKAKQREGSPRNRRCTEMRRVARKFKPTLVVHHPHQTDSPNIWQTAWSGAKKNLKTVQQGVSGIAYFPAFGSNCVRRDLSIVLERTKFGPAIQDVVISGCK